MKRKLARLIAFSAVALVGLVPIQASPAAAFAGTLDVVIVGATTNPEVAVTITNAYLELKATNTPAPATATNVNFDTDGNVLTPEETCSMPAGVGFCSVFLQATAPAAPNDVRAWVPGETTPPSSPCNPLPIPNSDCDSSEAQDEGGAGAGATAEPDDTDVVTVEWVDGVLNVEDENESSAPSVAVSMTATVLEKEPTTPPARALLANVDAEVTAGPNNLLPGTGPDAECDTAQTSGQCVLTYTPGATIGVDTVQSWVDLNENDPGDPDATPVVPPGGDETTGTDGRFEGDASEGTTESTNPGSVPEGDITDVVEVSISATQQLNVDPESQNKTINTPVTFTASVTLGGVAQSGVAVAAEIVAGGPNASKTIAPCNTGANGTCALTYTGTAAGTDKIRAGVDTDANGLPNEADATEDLTGSGTQAGGTIEPDTTDVVQVIWAAPVPPPPPPPDGDDTKCELAKKDVRKAKKALKKAKKTEGTRDDKQAKKRLKRAKRRKAAACG